MAHYKPKKSKVPPTKLSHKKAQETQMQKRYFCVFCAFLWLSLFCASLWLLMDQQCVVGRFYAFRTEIELLTVQENFNYRRAFELALDQRL